MAKRKVAKKGVKKRASLSVWRSKKFLFLVSVAAALVVVAGYTMFAGGEKTKGRIFSWKEGAVKNSYKVYGTNPDVNVYQHALYAPAEWNGAYYGVYTEKTTPDYGSRILKEGVVGQDVVVLKKALIYIGKLRVLAPTADDQYKAVVPVTIASRCPAINNISANNAFDASVTAVLKNCFSKGKIDTAFGDYLNKDGQMLRYAQVRILTLATHPGILDDGRAVKFTMNAAGIGGIGDGRVYSIKELNPNLTATSKVYNYYYQRFNYAGQKKYGPVPVVSNGVGYVATRVHLPYLYKSVQTRIRAENKGKLNDDYVLRGNDIKEMQSMLLYIKKKYPGTFIFKGLVANGAYDTATKAAVQEYRSVRVPGTTSKYLSARVTQTMFNDVAWPLYR